MGVRRAESEDAAELPFEADIIHCPPGDADGCNAFCCDRRTTAHAFICGSAEQGKIPAQMASLCHWERWRRDGPAEFPDPPGASGAARHGNFARLNQRQRSPADPLEVSPQEMPRSDRHRQEQCVRWCIALLGRRGTELLARNRRDRLADASEYAAHRTPPADCEVRRRSHEGSKLMLYFFRDAMTRSRGNIVEPRMTVAGLMPLTRTSGASETASSRTRWLTAALLTS